MTFIFYGLWFTAGLICGTYVASNVMNSTWKRRYDELHKAASSMIKESNEYHKDLRSSAEDRIKGMIELASELADQQLSMWRQLDGPSKGASHGKWKSGVIKQINALEEDKINIFRDILKEGYDLTISMVEEGGEIKKMKMSEVIGMHDMKDADTPKHQAKVPVEKPNHLKAVEPVAGDVNDKTTLARKPPKLTIIEGEVHDR